MFFPSEGQHEPSRTDSSGNKRSIEEDGRDTVLVWHEHLDDEEPAAGSADPLGKRGGDTGSG